MFIFSSIVDLIKDFLSAIPWLLCGIVGVTAVAAIAALALALLGAWVGYLFLNAESSLARRRDTIVPTVFTMFAALGAATASAAELPTGAAFVFALVVTGMMFVSSALRQVDASMRTKAIAKVVGSVGVLLSPAVSIAYLLSNTDLDKLSPTNWIVLVGSALILLAGIVAAFVFRRQGLAPT